MSERADDIAAAQAAASLLEQGRSIDALSRLLTAMAAGLLLLSILGPTAPAAAAGLLLVILVLGIAQAWLALRVGFDARLLRDLSADLGRLDAALTRLGLVPAAKVGRPLDTRLAGAMRLMRWQGLCLGLQLAVILAAGLGLALIGLKVL